MSLYSKNLEVCWDTHQALGLCRVSQEWNCILWSKMYWGCCLHGGLWCFFLGSCERVAPSRALHTCVCAKLLEVTGELLLSGWWSLICIVCMTLYSFSLCSPFKLQQQVNKNYEFGIYAKPLYLWACRGVWYLPCRYGQRGKKNLGEAMHLKQSSVKVKMDIIYWAVIIGK